MARSVWTLIALGLLALGVMSNRYAVSADDPSAASPAPEAGEFLELNQLYAFYLPHSLSTNGEHPIGGKLVEKRAGGWVKVDDGGGHERSVWWINLAHVAAVRRYTQPPAVPVGPAL